MKITSNLLNNDSIKLVQITDTHLFESADGSLLSVNTLDSLKAVVTAIIARNQDFDAVVSTGDISQDYTAESYQLFKQAIAPLKKTCFWLPGNHDFKSNMSSVLPSIQIKQVDHVLLGDKWQMILLDSQVEGAIHGQLSNQQLVLLEEKLAQNRQRHSLILLHHHPILVGSRWIDQYNLKNADHFWDVVEKNNNIKAILCGHVHQEINVMHNGVRVIATPSTCVQFKPNSNHFALDTLPAGWRELGLHSNGQLTTQVKRLPYGSFQPDFNSSGY